MSLLDMKLRELQEKLANKEITVSELVEHSLQRIEAVDGKVGAFLHVDGDRAMEEARMLDSQLQAAPDKQRGLLFGLPAGIKDNIVTEGMKTTCASKHLANYEPIYDATVMARLKEARAIAIGKLNMDEFAMGSSGENSAVRPVHNPWNLDCVPGGSSSGSAAAVAAGEVAFALGSDTGGSIRQPASYCGVVGLKPTYGLVSRFGLIALASSFDQIGPITRNVEDAAWVLQAIAGYDEKDSTSAKVEIPDYASALTGEVKGLKIGVPREYMGEGIDPAVKDAVITALKQLESLGAQWEEISLPHSEYATVAYYLLACAEASSNFARLDGIRYGVRTDNAANLLEVYTKTRGESFGPEVKRRLMVGNYVLSKGQYEACYLKSQKVRTLIRQDYEQAFQRYDVLISPSTPTPAFRHGDQKNDPLTMHLNDLCAVPASLTGNPAISVPCGFVDGLPVGLQIIGKPFDESTVLRVAHAYEQSTEFHTRRPAL